MDKSTHRGNQSHQFTLDDVARFCASTVNGVLEKLGIEHNVEGIIVLPLGESVYMVDIVMRDLKAELDSNGIWTLSITIPPSREVTNGRE